MGHDWDRWLRVCRMVFLFDGILIQGYSYVRVSLESGKLKPNADGSSPRSCFVSLIFDFNLGLACVYGAKGSFMRFMRFMML